MNLKQLINKIKARRYYYALRKKIRYSALFDEAFYLNANPDIKQSGADPLKHYLIKGGFEGRNPSDQFNSYYYLSRYPDVEGSGLNPLVHYFLWGKAEERNPKPEDSGFISYTREAYMIEKQTCFNEFIASGDQLVIPGQKPEVSIILVLYNQSELSFASLQSIVAHAEVPYEVIIVDNNSTDQTAILLSRITGANIIRNSENKHFLFACNQAAAQVKSDHILLLNNDAELLQGSLPAAMHAITTIADAGAVGGKIVLPDGLLQEAGSIIWNDGSCLGYGRGKYPTAYPYNFARVVDYCSGAFLLTKTRLFNQHGGFDTQFMPAYYEETDYCLWLQEQGLKVIYLPQAAIRHFEFASSEATQATDLQKSNKLKFNKKHNQQLAKHYSANTKTILKARFAASQQKVRQILFVDDRVPHLDQGSGNPRSNIILKCMHELGYQVTIFPNMFPDEENWHTAYRDINPFTEIARGIGFPRFSDFMAERSGYYDVVWVSRPHNMKAIITDIKKISGKAKIIYDAEAISAEREFLKERLNRKNSSNEKFQGKISEEFDICKVADTVVAVSQTDAEKFLAGGVKKVQVLGHTLVRNEAPPGFENRKGLLFVGNLDDENSPNVDSILWFVREIFPIIRKEIPEIEFHIAGSNRAESMRAIKSEGVYFHGRLADLSAMYNSNRVFVAPTRFAAGIPYKIHEAASFGIPVVATTLLMQQLGWNHGEQLLAAPLDPQVFATRVVELYQHEILWNHIQKTALDLINAENGYEGYKNRLTAILNE